MNTHDGSNERLSLKRIVVRYFAGWKDFRGRSSRMEYWVSVFLVTAVGGLLGYISSALQMVWILGTVLPSCAVIVRRLNDAGRSWKSLFWLLLPYVGPLVIFVFLLTGSRGMEKKNESDSDIAEGTDVSSEQPSHREEENLRSLPQAQPDTSPQTEDMTEGIDEETVSPVFPPQRDGGEDMPSDMESYDENRWPLRYRVLNAISKVTHFFAVMAKVVFKVAWFFLKWFVIIVFRLWRLLWERNRRVALWILALVIMIVVGCVLSAIDRIGAGLAWLGSEEARWVRISGWILFFVVVVEAIDWGIQRMLRPVRQMKARFDASVQQGQALVAQGQGLVEQGKAFIDTAKGIKSALQGKEWAEALRQGADLAQQGQALVNEAKELKSQG